MIISEHIRIESTTEKDIPVIFSFIKNLAEYEKLVHEVVATEDILRETLFGERRFAEVVIAYYDHIAAGYALFFHNFSTFVGRPGLYLEDLFVQREFRGKGIGTALLQHLARLAVERQCGRMEWAVLNWNAPAISFYKQLGARPMNEWTVYRLTGDALKHLAKA
ncbi:MAG: GNAT family N-acetyltransferase [Bacteroidota bacterium]|nr:GNAT family N-acetyltransferase [Bacteroidota bacterium]